MIKKCELLWYFLNWFIVMTNRMSFVSKSVSHVGGNILSRSNWYSKILARNRRNNILGNLREFFPWPMFLNRFATAWLLGFCQWKKRKCVGEIFAYSYRKPDWFSCAVFVPFVIADQRFMVFKISIWPHYFQFPNSAKTEIVFRLIQLRKLKMINLQ